MRPAAVLACAATLLVGGCARIDQQESAMEPMSFDAEMTADFDQSIERVTAALKAEGFGILTRVDLHTTFKEKLGVDMAPHTILGACNPQLAHKAVTATPEASLMLPCNVTVQQLDDERVIVRIVSPESLMSAAGFDEDPVVKGVGEDAHPRLQRVAAALRK